MNPKTFVPPSGDPKTAKLAIVGEQPDRTEIQSGRVFVGPAGRELAENLQTINLVRQDCYLTNFAKDRDSFVSKYLNLKTMTFNKRGLEYKEMLFKELNGLNTSVIVACGNYALAVLTNRTGITKWRGSILDNPELPGKWIIPCLHPETVNPGRNRGGQYLNKFLIQFDLRRALDISKRKFGRKIRKLITKPSFHDCLKYLKTCVAEGLKGNIIFFDIEIANEEVSCISFAFKDDEAISIPFMSGDGSYFLPDQELTVMIEIAKILEDPKLKKGGQNIGFDMHFLLRRYGIKAVNLEDTMIAQRIIMPDYKIGLDFITSVWTDHYYYKDEGKKYFGGGGWPQLWQYNATDSIICAEAFPKQMARLKQQSNTRTYKRQRDIVPPLVYMQERGILIDTEGMLKANKKMAEELKTAQQKLNDKAGQELNANSYKQLRTYFYGTLGYKAYINRKTKKPSTDDITMTRLARKGVKEAEYVKEIRKIRKLMGTYLPVVDGKLIKIDEDSRVRSSFNPAGTKFSRISSSANIFDTGMNLQNIPHSLFKYFLIDPDYIGYAIDLSQAENRIVAYVGNILPMIRAFETGIDVHKLTASLIFQKPIEEITTEDGTCSLGDGTHDERFWGKKANHGLNYDLGYRLFALLYQMAEPQARFIVDRYHMAYPGVRDSYHALVRNMLVNGRVVTNLMGRNTLFMDRWGDQLFKEAYSCIPQGTVGDVINERGLNFIYYNDVFKSVELLLQKHDEIVFQIPKSIPLIKHAEMITAIKECLEIPLMTPDHREFVVPADISVMPKTFDKRACTEIKGKDLPTVSELAKKLKEITDEPEK